ncbi:MAG: hypothetical protein KAQ99_02285 [Candidatus Aureabacteria bacterium]|nr:hypothetical protein [Candidatus Auribacterota bacterium]
MVDYAVIADLEKYLNVEFANPADPTIALFLTRASRKIDAYCNRDFLEHTDYIEYHNGKGRYSAYSEDYLHNSVVLENIPVIQVTEVVDNSNVLVEGTDYEVFENKALILLTPESRYFIKKIKGVKITYDWGYATVPDGIADICTWMVAQALGKQLKFSEAGVAQSVSIEGHTVSLPEIREIPADMLELLGRFARWEFG